MLGIHWKANAMTTLNAKRTALTLAGLVVLLAGPVSQETPADDRAVDREQISAVVSRWEDAWNRHDMRAFASLFHEDGVWILWTGDVWSGRDAIEAGHAAVHETIFKNSIQRERM